MQWFPASRAVTQIMVADYAFDTNLNISQWSLIIQNNIVVLVLR